MATWKKIITSGSAAELSSLAIDTALPVTEGGTGASASADAASAIGVGTEDTPQFSGITIDGGDITIAGANDILTIEAIDWDIKDNDASALSFDASGKAGMLEFVTTNNQEKVKMSAGLEVTGPIIGSSGISGSVTASGIFLDEGSKITFESEDSYIYGYTAQLASGESIYIASDNHIFLKPDGDIVFDNDLSGSATSTGSFGHLMGDGSSLTGLSTDIDSLDAYGAATLHQTEDKFVVSDNGTEKSITFSNLEDSIFANVSGDAGIGAGGDLSLAVTAITNQTAMTGDVVDTDEIIINDGGSLKRVDFSVFRDAVFNDVGTDATVAAGGEVTIADEAVTLAKMAHAAANTVLVRDANSEGDPSFKAVANTQILIGDGTGFTAASMSGDVTMTNAGAVTIAATSVEGSMLNDNVISGQGALGGADMAQADLLLIDDGPGTLKKVTYSNFEDSLFANLGGDISVAAGGSATISSISSNLTVGGDLTVNGDLTYLNTTNLLVKDQFIYAASGSSNVDGGLIVGGSTIGVGSALFWDAGATRWAVSESVAQNATTVTPNQFMTTVTINDASPGTGDGDYGIGEMWIEEDSDDIWIRTE